VFVLKLGDLKGELIMSKHTKLTARLLSLTMALVLMLANPLMNPYHVDADQYIEIIPLGDYDDDGDYPTP